MQYSVLIKKGDKFAKICSILDLFYFLDTKPHGGNKAMNESKNEYSYD